jgi:hypothetical protein
MIEKHLGHGVATINAEELAELRRTYSSIVEEPALIDKFFERPKGAAATPAEPTPAAPKVAGAKAADRPKPAAEAPIGPDEAERIRQREIAESKGDGGGSIFDKRK